VKGGVLGRRIGLALLALVFLAGLVLSTLSGGGAAGGPSVLSAEPEGRKALFLFLEELGFELRAWRSAPLALPEGPHALWVFETPTWEAGEDEQADAGPLHLQDPRHPLHYGEFVRRGGLLVTTGDEERLGWLREACGLELPDWTPTDPRSAHGVELEGGERLRLAPGGGSGARVLEPFEAQVPWDPDELESLGWRHLAVGPDGRPFASWTSVEEGRVLLLASDAFLDNERLGELDHGLLALRLVEAVHGGGRWLFDEFALGDWTPPGSLALLAAPGLREVALHLLAIALLLVAVHAWRREFARDPEPPRLDPTARLQAGARLLERAGRYDLLAHDLRVGLLRRCLEHLAGRREAAQLDGPTDPERLRELAARAGRLARRRVEPAVWHEAFAGPAVETRAQLERLAAELAALERRVAAESLTPEPVTPLEP